MQISHDNLTGTPEEWSNHLDIPEAVIIERKLCGWSDSDALSRVEFQRTADHTARAAVARADWYTRLQKHANGEHIPASGWERFNWTRYYH